MMLNFEFMKDIASSLTELAKKDKKYKPITDQLKKLLSSVPGEFLSFEHEHDDVVKDINQSHIDIQKSYEKTIKNLEQNFVSTKSQLEAILKQQKASLEQQNKELEEKTKLEIDAILAELERIDEAYKQQIQEALTLKSKEIAQLDIEINIIKRESAKEIAKIEAEHAQKLAKLEADYNDVASMIEEGIAQYQENIQSVKEKIVFEKNAYREQSDSKYLSIKNDYHHASTIFNKRVDQLKKKKEDALSKLQAQYRQDLEPIEKESQELHKQFIELKQKNLNEYQQAQNEHRELIHKIIERYELLKQNIIKESSEAITLLNSKLSSFRDNLQRDRQEETKAYREQLRALESDLEKDALSRERRRRLRAQDNELNRQIIRTRHDVQQQIKSQYIKLAEAEEFYLNEKSKWRLQGKLLEYDYKLKTINTDLLYQYRQKEIDTKIKKRKLKLDHDIELIELKYVEDIAPLEAELSIANAVSERDINLLSNDTNYHLSHYGQQEDLQQFEQQLFILEQNEQLDLAKIKLEHDRSVLSMTTQLSVEKETVKREQQLKHQNLKRELVLLSFEQSNLTSEMNYQLKKNDYLTKQEYLNKKLQSTKQLNDKLVSLYTDLYHLNIEFESNNLSQFKHLAEIDKDQEILSKDVNVVHSRIHYLFNQIYSIYNIHHHFMLQTIKLYQLPAHPEDIKTFITMYLNIFNDLAQIQINAIDHFLVDMKTIHETKINDLTGYRYKTSRALLEKNRDESLHAIELEKESIHQSIAKIEHQIIVLQTNVDRLQTQINHIETVLSTETNKKIQKQLRSEIESHQKSINALETEMSNHEKEIAKYQKPLDQLEEKIKKVHETFEENEAKLKTEQHEDARVYFEQMSFYEQLMKRLLFLFNTYSEKIKPLTERLNQPLYLTDDVVKNYLKNYEKQEIIFEKQSQYFYQELLSGSMKLYDTLNSEQEKLKARFNRQNEKQTALFNKNKLSISTREAKEIEKHQKYLESLTLEEGHVNEQLATNTKREKQSALDSCKQRILQTENQILQLKDRTQNELELIDANLQSVIAQLEADYQKNVQSVHDQLKKNTEKLKETITQRERNLKQLEESTALKNDVLQSRYQQSELKIISQLKEKQASYVESRDKKIQTYQKRLTSMDFELAMALEKHNQTIKTNQTHAELTVDKLKRAEEKVLQKDLEDARKSYRFKQKTLKL